MFVISLQKYSIITRKPNKIEGNFTPFLHQNTPNLCQKRPFHRRKGLSLVEGSVSGILVPTDKENGANE